jgi:hypothetical protein
LPVRELKIDITIHTTCVSNTGRLGCELITARDPELRVTHMLVTSWSEGHVGKVMQKDVRLFVSKISVIISGRGVATTILLNSAGDDEEIIA